MKLGHTFVMAWTGVFNRYLNKLNNIERQGTPIACPWECSRRTLLSLSDGDDERYKAQWIKDLPCDVVHQHRLRN